MRTSPISNHGMLSPILFVLCAISLLLASNACITTGMAIEKAQKCVSGVSAVTNGPVYYVKSTAQDVPCKNRADKKMTDYYCDLEKGIASRKVACDQAHPASDYVQVNSETKGAVAICKKFGGGVVMYEVAANPPETAYTYSCFGKKIRAKDSGAGSGAVLDLNFAIQIINDIKAHPLTPIPKPAPEKPKPSPPKEPKQPKPPKQDTESNPPETPPEETPPESGTGVTTCKDYDSFDPFRGVQLTPEEQAYTPSRVDIFKDGKLSQILVDICKGGKQIMVEYTCEGGKAVEKQMPCAQCSEGEIVNRYKEYYGHYCKRVEGQTAADAESATMTLARPFGPWPPGRTCAPWVRCTGGKLLSTTSDCAVLTRDCASGLCAYDRCRPECPDTPADSCDGQTLITRNDDCSERRIDCPAGCANGECNDDKVLEHPCENAMPGRCEGDTYIFTDATCSEAQVTCKASCYDGAGYNGFTINRGCKPPYSLSCSQDTDCINAPCAGTPDECNLICRSDTGTCGYRGGTDASCARDEECRSNKCKNGECESAGGGITQILPTVCINDDQVVVGC